MALVGCGEKAAPPKPAPPDVEVAAVVQQNVPIYAEYVAQLNGPVNAEITPRVQGYLLQQNYQNGFFVKKGQLLFTLDPRQYEAVLDQAKAQLGVAEANLSRADTDVGNVNLAAVQASGQEDVAHLAAKERHGLGSLNGRPHDGARCTVDPARQVNRVNAGVPIHGGDNAAGIAFERAIEPGPEQGIDERLACYQS